MNKKMENKIKMFGILLIFLLVTFTITTKCNNAAESTEEEEEDPTTLVVLKKALDFMSSGIKEREISEEMFELYDENVLIDMSSGKIKGLKEYKEKIEEVLVLREVVYEISHYVTYKNDILALLDVSVEVKEGSGSLDVGIYLRLNDQGKIIEQRVTWKRRDAGEPTEPGAAGNLAKVTMNAVLHHLCNMVAKSEQFRLTTYFVNAHFSKKFLLRTPSLELTDRFKYGVVWNDDILNYDSLKTYYLQEDPHIVYDKENAFTIVNLVFESEAAKCDKIITRGLFFKYSDKFEISKIYHIEDESEVHSCDEKIKALKNAPKETNKENAKEL